MRGGVFTWRVAPAKAVCTWNTFRHRAKAPATNSNDRIGLRRRCCLMAIFQPNLVVAKAEK